MLGLPGNPVAAMVNFLLFGRALVRASAGLRVTTMGRGPEEDELFFRAAAAAGQLAGTLLTVPPSGR